MLYKYKDLRGDEYDQPDWKVFCTIVPSRDISRNLDSMEGKLFSSVLLPLRTMNKQKHLGTVLTWSWSAPSGENLGLN